MLILENMDGDTCYDILHIHSVTLMRDENEFDGWFCLPVEPDLRDFCSL